MVSTALALPAQHATEPVDHLVERRPELRALAVRDDGLRTIDMDDDLDLLRVFLLDEYDLGPGGLLLVLREGLDLVPGALQDLIGNITVSFGDLDSHHRTSLGKRG